MYTTVKVVPEVNMKKSILILIAAVVLFASCSTGLQLTINTGSETESRKAPPEPTDYDYIVGLWRISPDSFEAAEDSDTIFIFSNTGYALQGKIDEEWYINASSDLGKWQFDPDSRRIVLLPPSSSEIEMVFSYEFDDGDYDYLRLVPQVNGESLSSETVYLIREEPFVMEWELDPEERDFHIPGSWNVSKDDEEESIDEVLRFMSDKTGLVIPPGEAGRSPENAVDFTWDVDRINRLVFIHTQGSLYPYEFIIDGQDQMVLLSMAGDENLYLSRLHDEFTAEMAKESVVPETYSVAEAKPEAKEGGKKSAPPSGDLKPDKDPPLIAITSPDVSRGIETVAVEKRLRVVGTATDESGIFEITVNGVEAEVNRKGEFSADINLAVGENTVTVVARDPLNNESVKTFTVQRGEGKVAKGGTQTPQTKADFIEGTSYALIIGVQNYQDKHITALDQPISDAQKLYDILNKQYRFEKANMVFLKDPDRKKVFQAFQDLKGKITDKDSLLIFYAGHGYWDEDMKQGYWLPVNAAPEDPSEWIPNSTIRDYVRGIKARHTLLIADACFSGGIFKTRDAFAKPDASIQKMYEMPSRKAITSGALKTVPDKSVFVEYLIKRLSENKDPYLYSEKLYINFKDAVINNSPVNQTPMFGTIAETGDEGGDFIFVRR